MNSHKSLFPWIICLCVLGLGLSWLQPASAQRLDDTPEEVTGVEIEEKLNTQIPLELQFKNSEDQEVQLSRYFDGDKPVILTLVYFRCPMLCGVILESLLETLKEIKMTVGDDFEIITVSFDPLETPRLAKTKKQNLLREYGRPGADQGWHFLTGRESQIKKLTSAVGFNYKYNEERQEYAHAAALFISTPEGSLSRYLYGIDYDPQTLRLSLVEASEGKIGSTIDRLILTCFHYDPSTNRYAPLAMNIMRLGGGITVVVLGIVLTTLWIRDARRKRQWEKQLQA